MPDAQTKIVPLLLAGGAGTRLWPLSRGSLPKQFIALVGGRSTYQQTLKRLAGSDLFAPPVVLTNAQFQSLASKQAEELGIDVEIVLEPARRDSCAAILAGAMVAAHHGGTAPVLAVAADHVMFDEDLFVDAVRRGAEAARAGRIVVFGLLPNEPKSSVGYIRPGALIGEDVAELAQFVEKPDVKTAARYIEEGMLWNGGNFLFRSDVLIEEARRLAPSIHDPVAAAVEKAQQDGNIVRLDAASFAQATALSIDYAIMEKTDKAAVVKSRYRFSDVGSWEAVFEASEKDADGNHLAGEVEAINTKNSYVRSEGHFTAVLGLDHVIVVTTPDAVLVASRHSDQLVKDLVARIEKRKKRLVTDSW